MKRVFFLVIIALVCPGLTVQARADAPKKPNVVFLVGDDFNNNLGCYGHPIVKTPHIDKLAERGVRFDRAYSNVPVCNPSRTSFLSGRRPKNKDKDVVYLPNHFSTNGYYTVEVGKVRHSYGVSKKEAVFDEYAKTPKDAVAFLGRKHEKPFLLAVGLTHTHPGYAFTPAFLKLYPDDKMVLPKEPPNIKELVPADALRGLHMQSLTEAEHRTHLSRYYASISTLDNEVGAIHDALDKHGLAENTIVLLTSDHGRMLGEHGGIFDKRCLFEQSVRVPFIVAAPGFKGKTCARLVENVDIYPTLVDLCGLPMPEGLEGLSVTPLLRDPQRAWRQAAFAHSPVHPQGVTMRTERYRYTEWGNPKLAELYDHESDPLEHRNLVNDPAQAERVAEIRRMFAAGWKGALPK